MKRLSFSICCIVVLLAACGNPHRFSTEYSIQFISILPGHNPAVGVTRIEVWKFADRERSPVNSLEQVAKRAELVESFEGRDASTRAFEMWQLLASSDSNLRSSMRVKNAYAVIITNSNGDLAAFEVRSVDGADQGDVVVKISDRALITLEGPKLLTIFGLAP